MGDATGHLDLDDLKKQGRKGWFAKEDQTIPHPFTRYRSSCKQSGHGFLGPNFGAHHVIPQVSVNESIDAAPAHVRELIPDVQYVTDYVLNDHANMIGLPSFWAYDVWYQVLEARRVAAARRQPAPTEYPGTSASWKASYPDTTRLRWTGWVIQHLNGVSRRKNSPCPEQHPIHSPPANWGHLEYSVQVTKALANVWNVLEEERDRHRVKVENLDQVRVRLKQIEAKFYKQLTTRGETSPELWEKRKDPKDESWYGPYTMTDVEENPIWR